MGEGDLAIRGSTAAALDAYLVFEDEAGFSMTPPTARTWSHRGNTPIARVRGRSQRRMSIAALACYKTGERSRLIYRPIVHADHKAGGRRSFAWTDHRDLLVAAHQQLGRPIVLVWDNLNVHRDRRLHEFIDAHDWITVRYLPPYAPQLNPGRGRLVPPAKALPGQHRLHRPHPPDAHPATRPSPGPIPARPHRRMPRRHRAHFDDITPQTSVTGLVSQTITVIRPSCAEVQDAEQRPLSRPPVLRVPPSPGAVARPGGEPGMRARTGGCTVLGAWVRLVTLRRLSDGRSVLSGAPQGLDVGRRVGVSGMRRVSSVATQSPCQYGRGSAEGLSVPSGGGSESIRRLYTTLSWS
ncbi:hypothetical protein J2Z21_009119 [Streptomyces griseochromogenes]|uniref:Tc1-like transposase DDE domain-containing protein n=1 Tax=Streptomyces griseochromogenes TaxID=68214 RepID=A0ABS4M9K8_9ACTN|nr:hypothetical protein [Streptomyces griseochromogenes]